MKSKRFRRRDFRCVNQDSITLMERPAQHRSAAEIARISKILAEIGTPGRQPERGGQ